MKDLIEGIDSRIKNPLFGYFFVASLTYNWQELFYLFTARSSISDRIAYFNAGTDAYTLFVYPLLIAALYAILSPWVNYSLLYLVKKPNELNITLQAEAEHKLITKQKQLEDEREKQLVRAENELINRAKRDEKLEDIEDEETRKKLKSEIEELRRERDEYRANSNEADISEEQLEIFKLLARNGGRMVNTEIVEESRFDKIKAEYYLEDLEAKGYASSTRMNFARNIREYSLTKKGKKFVIDNGLSK